MTKPIYWLSKDQVLHIHARVMALHGGGGVGIRDQNLFESSLAHPLNMHSYGENDIFMLAAGYAESLARNHAFIDGNKRIAYAAADYFLYANGYDFQHQSDHATFFENISQGKLSREAIADFYRQHCVARDV